MQPSPPIPLISNQGPKGSVAMILSLVWFAVLAMVYSLGIFTGLEESVLDHLQRFPAPQKDSPDLALIDIQHVPSDRPWPWPRLDYALILDGLKPQHPQSVVFEMLLHDQDARYTSFDSIFADQVGSMDGVLFSAAALRPDDAAPPPKGIVALRTTGNFQGLSPFGSFFWPVETFSSLGQVGICNLSAEKNHYLRSVELVFRFREQILPSLSLWAAALRLRADMSRTTVELGHEIVLRDHHDQILRRIPIDDQGTLRLRFRQPETSIPRINSDDLVLAADQAERGAALQVDLKPLVHRQIWVGATDPNVVPIIATVGGPLPPVLIQMQATHQILTEDYVRPLPGALGLGIFLVVGLWLSRNFVTLGIRYGLMIIAVTGLLLLLVSILAFQLGNIYFPLATSAVHLAGVTICGLAASFWEFPTPNVPDPQISLDFNRPREK